ncbi:hypothetical protein AB838_22020 [Rhodobacteraceae bacterium (ex Bugula neritina AB1)]|nr:hypothetical protein AB838_22020 [Rhodobacteraceae bacterium (ex Bugula neritina AB1)]
MIQAPILSLALYSTSVKSALTNYEPWSEFNSSGGSYLASAFCSAWPQKPASIEFDSRQLSTFRLCLAHDRHKVPDAPTHRGIADVGTPDLIEADNGQSFEKMWVNPVLRMPAAGLQF